MKRILAWGLGFGFLAYLLLPVIFGILRGIDPDGLALFMVCYAVIGTVFVWDYRKASGATSKKIYKVLCPTYGNPMTQMGMGDWRCHHCQAKKRPLWL